MRTSLSKTEPQSSNSMVRSNGDDFTQVALPPAWKAAIDDNAKARAQFRVQEATFSKKDSPKTVTEQHRESAVNKASSKQLGMAIISQALGYAKFGTGSAYPESSERVTQAKVETQRMSARGVRRVWLGLSSMFTNVREAGNDVHRDIRSLEMTDQTVYKATARAIASIERSLEGKANSGKSDSAISEVLGSVKQALSTSALDPREQRAILASVQVVLDTSGKVISSGEYRKSLEELYLSAPSQEHRRAYTEAVGRWRAGLKSLVTSAVSRTASALSAASLGAVGAISLASAAEALLQRRYNVSMERFALGHRLRTMATAGTRELQAFFDTDSYYPGEIILDENGVRRADAPKAPVNAYADARQRYHQESSSIADRATAVRNMIRNGYHILTNVDDYQALVDAGKIKHSIATASEYNRLKNVASNIERELGAILEVPGADRRELVERIEDMLCVEDPFSDAARCSFVNEIRRAEELTHADFLRESEANIERSHSFRTPQGAWQLASRFGLNVFGNSLAVVAAGLRASADAVQGLHLIPIGKNAAGQTEQLVSEYIGDRVAAEFSRVTGLKVGLGALPGVEAIADQFSQAVGNWVSDAAITVNKLVTDFGWNRPFEFLTNSPNFSQQWDVSSGDVEAKGFSFALRRGVGASGLGDAVVKDAAGQHFAVVAEELKRQGFDMARFYDFGADSWIKKSIDGLHSALWVGAGLLSMGASFQSAKAVKRAPDVTFVPPIPEVVQVVEPQGYRGSEDGSDDILAKLSEMEALRAPRLPTDRDYTEKALPELPKVSGAIIDVNVEVSSDVQERSQNAVVVPTPSFIMPPPIINHVVVNQQYGNRPLPRGIFAVASEAEKCLITPVKRTNAPLEFSQPTQLDRRDVWIANLDSGKDLGLVRSLVSLGGQLPIEGDIASENGIPLELMAYQWEQFRTDLEGKEQLMFIREQLYCMGVEKSAGFGRSDLREFRFDRSKEFASYLESKRVIDELTVKAAAVQREKARMRAQNGIV